jgi:hypothetical protein
MTDISSTAEAARESARVANGQFGEQTRTAPDPAVFRGGDSTIPVIAHARAIQSPPVPYPATIPAGGQVTADLEDSGGVYVTVTFPDHANEFGEPVTISFGGGDGETSYDEWNSITNGEPGFADDEVNGHVIGYLREVRAHVDGNAESVRWAATQPLLEAFVKTATGADEPRDNSDEASLARAGLRGEQMVKFASSEDGDDQERAADAIADILIYARSKGLDLDELVAKAERYVEED